MLKRDRDAARSLLSQRLSVLHDAERLRVSIVFDGRGDELVLERPYGQPTFTRLYTPSGMTADDVIEQIVGQAREPGHCVVATDDRAERQTIEALGAAGMSAADLAAWVARAEQRQSSRIADKRHVNDREWDRPRP